MKLLKKFCLWFLALMPLSAGAVMPLVIGGAAVGVGLFGVSIWRTASPVKIADALDFFSSCWTCQMFSDVMVSMSNLLPKVYSAIGEVVIPMSVALLAFFMAWRMVSGFVNGKLEEATKITANFGTYMVKLCFIVALMLIPLPRLATSVFFEPALSVGTSMDYIVSKENNKFAECMVATAISDPFTADANAAAKGAFSPNLRHQLVCELANVHQVTGLGLTVGWVLMNMAFNTDYMHKILSLIPIFPNVPIFLAGLAIFVLYFMALLPIPLFFLEIFIKLSMDLIMLPLMLMSWMFDDKDFAIFPKGGRTIRQMIDDVVKGAVGIALTVIFLTFSVMFLNAAFGSWGDVNILQEAIAANDSKKLMDGLMMANDSVITVLLMGIFIAMFLTMIPQLTNLLFKIKISEKYYDTAKADVKNMWGSLKNWYTEIKK